MIDQQNNVPLVWSHLVDKVDWNELSALHLAAPLKNKKPADLKTVFKNSLFRGFVHNDGKRVGIGRTLADGVDCAPHKTGFARSMHEIGLQPFFDGHYQLLNQ